MSAVEPFIADGGGRYIIITLKEVVSYQVTSRYSNDLYDSRARFTLDEKLFEKSSPTPPPLVCRSMRLNLYPVGVISRI